MYPACGISGPINDDETLGCVEGALVCSVVSHLGTRRGAIVTPQYTNVLNSRRRTLDWVSTAGMPPFTFHDREIFM